MNEDCAGEFVVGQVVAVLRREDAEWGENEVGWDHGMDATVGRLGVVREANLNNGVYVEFPQWGFNGPWWYPAWVLSPVSAGPVAPEILSQMEW